MKEQGSHFLENEAAYLPRINRMERESHLTVAEISDRQEMLWTQVIRRIAPFKEQLELPQEVRSLRKLVIPRSVFEQIPFVTETDTPAGDWMTTTEMADNLNVKFGWVNRRILDLSSVGEYRICHPKNRPRFHLPPEALEELREIRNRELGQFEPGTYLNLFQIAGMLGRHQLWIRNRLDDILDDLGAEPKLGLDSSGKPVEHYPEEVLGPLTEEKDKYEDSGDRLTIRMLEHEIGKGREWVEGQLEEMGARGEYRRYERSGRVDLSFSRETLIELLNRAEAYVDPGPDWYTANALGRIVGKSSNWVRGRLNSLNAEPRSFQDSHGVPRKHYSPEVLSSLLKMKEDWRVFQILESEQYGGDDEIKQLRKVLAYGQVMSRSALLWIGIKESEMEKWMKMGLITRRKNGQYYLTKVAEKIAQRATIEEEGIKDLDEMKLWLERSFGRMKP